MKKFFLALALILIASTDVFANPSKFAFLADSSRNLNSLRFSYSQNHSSVDTGNSKSLKNTSLRLKDPDKALMLAIFPGFFLHGTGHLYAGKPKTALLLFSVEIVGTLLIIRGSVRETGGSKDKDESPILDVLVGGFFYFGSWFYDLIGSPLEVKKRNEELLRSTNIDIGFEIKESLHYLKLVKKF